MCFFCTSELTDMNLIMEVAKRWGYHTFMVWWYNKAAGFFEAVGTSWDLRGFVSARRIFDLELPIYFYITILPPKISLTQWKSFVTFVGPLKHYHWNSYLSTQEQTSLRSTNNWTHPYILFNSTRMGTAAQACDMLHCIKYRNFTLFF